MAEINNPEKVLHGIADTAFWSAIYRACESNRPDALVHDRFAERLAGKRGEEIAQRIPEATDHSWVIIVRTYLIDAFIKQVLDQDVDMVLNLAAGLDARPYRMPLPSSLKWVEIDLPEIIKYKESVLESETPTCVLERIPLDLSDRGVRRQLFQRLNQESRKVVIVTEGLLVYFEPEEVSSLATDLSMMTNFNLWIFDLQLRGLVRLLQQRIGSTLEEAGAALKFCPKEGPDFFIPYHWNPVEMRSIMETAVQAKRVPGFPGIQANGSKVISGSNNNEQNADVANKRSSSFRRMDGLVCLSRRV